jgi:hypothetical protein
LLLDNIDLSVLCSGERMKKEFFFLENWLTFGEIRAPYRVQSPHGKWLVIKRLNTLQKILFLAVKYPFGKRMNSFINKKTNI